MMGDGKNAVDRRSPDGFTLRDEANALVAIAFRNGPLEDLHAGTDSQLLEDLSLSRITDAQMKVLMINACETLEGLLQLKQDSPEEYDRKIKSANSTYCQNWNR